MGQKVGSPPLYLVTSAPEARNPRLAREAELRLEECRAMLLEGGETETVRLLDIALLQLRMNLRGICETELSSFCEALTSRETISGDRDANVWGGPPAR